MKMWEMDVYVPSAYESQLSGNWAYLRTHTIEAPSYKEATELANDIMTTDYEAGVYSLREADGVKAI